MFYFISKRKCYYPALLLISSECRLINYVRYPFSSIAFERLVKQQNQGERIMIANENKKIVLPFQLNVLGLAEI